MKILLDEQLSPQLVDRLAVRGVFAQHIVRIGRSGLRDPQIWRLAFAQDQVVVTMNVDDFLFLAQGSELHCGLIVLRTSHLTPHQQWLFLEPAIDFCLQEERCGRDLVNRVVEVSRSGRITCYALPA